MTAPVHWRLGHRPELDALRAIAVLLVMGMHASAPRTYLSGNVGVELFFVLSGFLITTLLIAEHRRTGTISLRRFYARRARRLFPALAVVLVVMTPVLIATVHEPTETLLGAFAGAAYIANIVEGTGAELGGFGQLWSLSVEEHFYLLWPVALLLVLRRFGERAGLVVAIAGAAASAVARDLIYSHETHSRVYYGSDTRASGLLIGCALAFVVTTCRPRPLPRALALPGLAFLSTMFLYAGPLYDDPVVWGYLWMDLAAVSVVYVLVSAATPRAVGRTIRALAAIGRRSYSLYLWHVPWLTVFGAIMTEEFDPARALPALGVAAVCAELSYRFVEPRFRARPTDPDEPRGGGGRDRAGDDGLVAASTPAPAVSLSTSEPVDRQPAG